MLHKDVKFPSQGTFTEQTAYIDTLPQRVDDGPKGQAIKVVLKNESPFAVDSKDIPVNVKVEVYHHSLSAPPIQSATAPVKKHKPAETDSDSDNDEGQQTTAVITRVLKVSNQSKKEKITAHMANNNDTATSFTLRFNADGTIKSVKQKLVPMEKIQQGLFSADHKSQIGVVVKAKEESQQGELYTHIVKPNKS
jgi:hypothetical protein